MEKKFAYGDEQSPMLREDVWNSVVKFYNLEEYEKEADKRFLENYEYRKLTIKDLININVPLNVEFEKMYFK